MSAENDDLEQRADTLFRERYKINAKVGDRIFAYLMVAQWVIAIVVALMISPHTWAGKSSAVHIHVYLAIGLGGAISSLPVFLAITRPGEATTRYVIAVAQMLWSALLVHLTGGRIETHFHVFVSLAFLSFYRDWKVFVPATIVVASDHLIRQIAWPESVYGMAQPEWWRFLEHAGWVLFEDTILVVACAASVREMRAMARQQIAIELHERTAAANMQTSVLPQRVAVDGLATAAGMRTADQVGGDYYDIVPVEGGCWIAIGDVAGHGTRAGLTMLQAQSALGAIARHDPDARPAKVWDSLNRTYIDNVRTRMRQDEHMTLSLVRYHIDGRLEIVGAHEEILIWRAATKTCELVPIRGTWIGLTAKARMPVEQTVTLASDDVVVLYTDGIIEARDEKGVQVGIDRLCDTLVEHHDQAPEEIRDAIFRLAERDRTDDASVMVLRYQGCSAVADVAA